MKNKLLQHLPTGRIFAWDETLAERADMIDYVPQPAAIKSEEQTQPIAPDDEIKAMARAVLTKKLGRTSNEAKVKG
jgi:hypothetical protein